MPIVSEYKNIPADAVWSTRVILETGKFAHNGRRIDLVEILEGWTIVGSMARWQEHRWSVCFEFESAQHGRQYMTHMAARFVFDEVTGNEVVQ